MPTDLRVESRTSRSVTSVVHRHSDNRPAIGRMTPFNGMTPSPTGPARQKSPKSERASSLEPALRVAKTIAYEQPLVEPQFGHLWQAPLRTISVPHSWHGGASVSCTHARSLTSTGIDGSMPALHLDRDEVLGEQRDLRQVELRGARGRVALDDATGHPTGKRIASQRNR